MVEESEKPLITGEQLRRQGQRACEWLDEEMSVIPVFGKVQRVTGISASL